MISFIEAKMLFKNQSDLKVYLFFLSITTVLWVFIQFSKRYTRGITYHIRYKGIEKQSELNPSSTQSMMMVLKGNGFRLLAQSLWTPTLTLHQKDFLKDSQGKYFLPTHKRKDFFQSKLFIDAKVIEMALDTIHLVTDKIVRRKICLKAVDQLSYAKGYASDSGISLALDSIWVEGPSQYIDTLRYVFTDPIIDTDIKSNLEGKISTDLSSYPFNLKVSKDKIDWALEVSKITEGQKNIPIELVNVPKNVKLKIFPKQVSVLYKVSLSMFNQVSAADFKVIADYQNATAQTPYLMLSVEDYPNYVSDLRLEDKSVQFIRLK